ncbi:MAG: hypothetical protein K0R00_1910 [Herbinix sp.]|jgi:hypothetical protein|nr:hypothetical protein [Herbinix sp.]
MMNKLEIFEPAMCCPTGLCGVDVDPELLRITTVLNTIEKNGVKVERYNLSSAPHEFIKNIVVTDYIRDKGVEALPISVLNGEIVIQGRYPMNEELVQMLNIPLTYVECQEVEEITNSEAEEECCGGSCCCSDSCC